MQNAVNVLLSREGPFQVKLLADLTSFFQPSESEGDWVLRELCTQLLNNNPLKVSSAMHIIFWDILRSISLNIQTTPETADFLIVLDNGEHVVYLTFYYALVAILRTLVDPRLHNRLQTVNGIPQSVLVAFLQRAGLRAFMLGKVLRSIEDTIDMNRLYGQGYIGVSAFNDLTDRNWTLAGAANENPYETPLPELDDWNTVFEPAIAPHAPLQAPIFPERKFHSNRKIASSHQLQLLCGLYTVIWQEIVPALENYTLGLEMEKHEHATGCKCLYRFSNIDCLMSIMHVMVTQNLDVRTMAKTPMLCLFNNPIYASVLSKLENLAAGARNWLQNRPEGALFYMHVQQHESFVQTLQQHWQEEIPELMGTQPPVQPSTVKIWQPLIVREWPVQLLLDWLDACHSFVHWSARLRCFLAGKSRTNYTAYRFRAEISSSVLEYSLAVLKAQYGSQFPELFSDCCIVRAAGKSFLVATPSTMAGLRLLQTLSIATSQSSQQQRTHYYTNIFMKHFVGQQRLGVYCLVSYVAFLVGGKRILNFVADPRDDEAYAIYAFLPHVLMLLPEIQSPDCRPTVIAFLSLNLPHCINRETAGSFLEATEADALRLDALHRSLKRFLRSTKTVLPMRKEKMQRHLRQIYMEIFTNSRLNSPTIQVQMLKGLTAHTPCGSLRHISISDGFFSMARSLETYQSSSPTLQSTIEDCQTIYRKIRAADCMNFVNYAEEELIALAEAQFAVQQDLSVVAEWNVELTNLNMVLLQAEWQVFKKPTPNFGEPLHPMGRADCLVKLPDRLPLSTAPLCFHEESFCVFIDPSQWPKNPVYPQGFISTAGDRPVVHTDMLADMALQYSSDWIPGITTQNTVYDGTVPKYVKCVMDWQKLILPPGNK